MFPNIVKSWRGLVSVKEGPNFFGPIGKALWTNNFHKFSQPPNAILSALFNRLHPIVSEKNYGVVLKRIFTPFI